MIWNDFNIWSTTWSTQLWYDIIWPCAPRGSDHEAGSCDHHLRWCFQRASGDANLRDLQAPNSTRWSRSWPLILNMTRGLFGRQATRLNIGDAVISQSLNLILPMDFPYLSHISLGFPICVPLISQISQGFCWVSWELPNPCHLHALWSCRWS